MEVVMDAVVNAVRAASRQAATLAIRAGRRRFALAAACLIATLAAAIVPAQAQRSQLPAQRRVVVIGEGSISVAPDYARITSGVTTRAKTAKEAVAANSKAMAAITAALLNAGIEQKDIQTARFSLQPIYETHPPNNERRLSGFSVSNEVNVTVRQIDTAGEILDRLITAGATDAGNVEFLHSDTSKALDQAREAAVADARRKAELYARASGLALGSVAWIKEDSAFAPPMSMAMRTAGAMASPVPVAAGEDILRVRITVGFDMSH